MPAYTARQRALAEEENRQRAPIGLARLKQQQRLADLGFQEQFSYKNRRGQTPCLIPYGPSNPRPEYRL
jgi:hypothetical protein